ncbi:protein-L-isoaspartate(D-aspartate) O-methyltransferase [Spinactinospora alkalitolerans]|uniref:Protein-L-isoaspartate O-methyltransferase n=1 Tax=Spinactinospora alkalitolerans TaxID=687207 RepID=A0A852TYG3_9ACTN|nr:methyltransferase domain-containing protein [Spinactinospora alkalitolerans]NYE48327.1 protein-L-isoaspartate(D-aspartate) O-methyltransferase [Spinactinospora alkalitolerans]
MPDADDLAVLADHWASEVRAAKREHFIPDVTRAGPMSGGPSHWVDRTADPEKWRAAVYSDTTMLTQVDDGATMLGPEAPPGLPTSSSTAPSLVVEFLNLLDPYPGDRVLEVGTGTGWTAALLAARLGPGAVTTIEVDDQVARQAAMNLKRSGYEARVVVGDGADGWAEGAPYDRVHVTCAVADIPFAWVRQTRPGGVIALPWAPTQVWGHKVTLTVTGDGRAVGRFRGDTSFMMLRSQRPALPDVSGHPRESRARVDPLRMTSADRGLEVAAVGLLPGVDVTGLGVGDDRVSVWDPGSGSYALAVRDGSGSGAEVTEYGPRSLWTELEDTYLTWVGLGEPGRERFGLLVDARGQHVWLDRSDNLIGVS